MVGPYRDLIITTKFMAKPVLTLKAMRSWEADSWAQGILEEDVIARVGQRIGERIMESSAPGDAILLLAGKGHNGDDVRAACSWISDRKITLINLRQPASQITCLDKALSDLPDLIVEGLFGIGLNRSLEGSWEDVVNRINACPVRTVAIDIPSGLDPDDGKPQGATIRADQTWTVGAVKKGMLASGASEYVGRLEIFGDVGLAELDDHQSDLYFGIPSDFCTPPFSRPVESHKGNHGCTMLFAGSCGYHGAAVLAARGATKARPGLVALATHEPAYLAIASQLQNVMVHPVKKLLLIPPKATSVVIGPGLASSELPLELRSQVVEVWETFPAPVVIDASALDWLPSAGGPQDALRVITPHPGEAARLLGCKAHDVQSDRVKALRSLSDKFGNCHIVLKGHQTLIGTSTGPVYVNPSGNPSLAQGGSGDILAGFIGGLLAQETWATDPLMALRYGVWVHGNAADICETQHDSWEFDQLLDCM
jgi:ADP-dependent NAD(P)H-hydrate dehydratase / NAD(P)H-hydrate epimerase